MIGVEGSDVVGADHLLIVAMGPAEPDLPRVPLVSAAGAIDPLVGAGVAEILPQFGCHTEGEAGKTDLLIGI